jgi:hypothetical protein
MMRGASRLKKRGTDLRWGPGRHTAGNNTFSYFTTPAGFAVEYTADLDQVDFETHEAKVHAPAPTIMDQWGIGVGGRRPCRIRRPTRACSSRWGLIVMALFEYFRTISGTCRSPSRWNRAARSARSSTCASRSGCGGQRCRRRHAAVHEGLGRHGRQAAGTGRRGRSQGSHAPASNKLERASLYLFTAERMQGHGAPGRKETYAKARAAFDKSTQLGKINRERVEIPLENGTMPALFTRAPGEGQSRWWCSATASIAARNCSTGPTCRPNWRGAAFPRSASTSPARARPAPARPAGRSAFGKLGFKAVDWLEQQPEVDPKAIGMTGISLGGHFAPRAVAYEPPRRGVGRQPQLARSAGQAHEARGRKPRAALLGARALGVRRQDQDDFLAKSEAMNLNGHMDRIRVPFLVTHGANDRQISVAYADDLYDQLVNSPRREKVIFTPREGGVEHVGADNMSYGRDCWPTGLPRHWAAIPPDENAPPDIMQPMPAGRARRRAGRFAKRGSPRWPAVSSTCRSPCATMW